MQRTIIQKPMFTEEKKNTSKFYYSAETYRNNLLNKLKEAKKEIDEGKGIPAKVAFAEMRAELKKYGCI